MWFPDLDTLVRTRLRETESRFSSGFTLIELVLVIVIIGLISAVMATRFDSIQVWRVESDIRRFADLWGFLYSEAFARGDSYRLVMDLNRQVYYVRREVPVEENEVRQVDYLANFRTKGERERRAKKEQEDMVGSLQEEFEKEDRRLAAPLDVLFYQTVFSDPQAPQRLTVPLEFPSLAEEKSLPDGLVLRDVVVNGETSNNGQVYLQLSPSGSSEIAAIHFEAGENVFTVSMDPATGRVTIDEGDLDFSVRSGLSHGQK